MTGNAPLISAVALLSAAMLGGCSTGGGGADIASGAASPASPALSLAQSDAVTAAARQMSAEPAAAVHNLKARRAAGEPGIHVCGYVRTAANSGIPLYVELREKDGAPIAERGQIGATPTNLAKVRFMCRAHGEW